MAMRSSIRKVSQSDLHELNQRARATWYSDIDQHLAWLTEKGYEISRSSLHRYFLRLRETDKANGEERAEIASQKVDAGRQRKLLLERLGELRIEEMRLIRQIEALGEMGQ